MFDVNTNTSISFDKSNWSRLLHEAITKPGMILEAYRAFWNYSIGNQILAMAQCHFRGIQAGPLATFNSWKEKGRSVKRGEKALMLCMPITVKDKSDEADDDADYMRFIYRNRWFVYAQTEGEEVEVEPLPQWSKEKALETLNIKQVEFDMMNGNAQGYAFKRSFALNPIAKFPYTTIFHELGHIVLGHTSESDFVDGDDTPKNLREVEAEAVSLLCCSTLNLNGAEYSRGYIQHWINPNNEIPEKSAQKIFRAADGILKAGYISR